MSKTRRAFISRAEVLWAAGLAIVAAATAVTIAGLPTNLDDFFGPGTQPNELNVPLQDSNECAACHGGFDDEHEPFRPWNASPMGQAARDPLFWAAVAIANQDAQAGGDTCIRCHTPGGWLAGRSTPTDGSQLTGIDFQGVSCNFCHRMVDPNNHPGAPVEDAAILAGLTTVIPTEEHSANYVVDPEDRRRGPYMLEDFFIHQWRQSPFHKTSEMCATCHDVSNPLFERQPDGSYALGTLRAPAANVSGSTQFPEQRTYSEWLASDFADGPIDMTDRFGGVNPFVSSCQDCHMPDAEGVGCSFGEFRDDLPQHQMNGGNTWLLNAVRELYPDTETMLDDESVARSIARTVAMLENASDMQLGVDGSDLTVKIINESGHKLPTGYPEGRRMWVNVRFFDAKDALIAERGAYDFTTAVLSTSDTKVYEMKLGSSPDVAAQGGIPAGEGFHLLLNNQVLKDNRIPPRGFTNAEFDALQIAPVGQTYNDGENFDITNFGIPAGAASADVRVYYQSTSKEYVEFLRDENTTNAAGQTMYDVWVATGKSEPVVMDMDTITFGGGCNAADVVEPFGVLDLGDLQAFVAAFLTQDPLADIAAPFGVYDLADVQLFIATFQGGCP
jgi:mono/diheme cytochrome c family protein